MISAGTAENRTGRNSLRALLDTRLDAAWMLRIEVYLLIIVQFLTNAGFIPTAATYLFDIVNLTVLLMGLKKVARTFSSHPVFISMVVGYCCLAVLTGIGSGVSPACVIWEMLIQLRIPCFVLLCVTYWSRDDVHTVMGTLMRLQPINLIFAAVEYFALGLTGDCCGGLFGTAAGSNMMLNMYLVVVVAYAASVYLGSAETGVSFGSLLFTTLSSFFVATLSEIKFFYLEAVIVVLIAMFFGRKSHRLFLLSVVFSISLGLGLGFLAAYFPESFDMLFDIDALQAYDDGSNVATSGYGISRAGAIEQIDQMFFGNDVALKVAGYGFGSTTMSSINIFCSPFYWSYSWLRYYYSQIAMLYLQNGYIGLLMYFSIHLFTLFFCLKNKTWFADAPWVRVFSICIGAMFFLNCFYNGSSRSYASLLWAMCFAIPFIFCITSKERANDRRFE